MKIIKYRLLTTYHFQIDRQSKVLNQIMKNYLQFYTFKDQTVWAKLLSLAQFIYNNSQNHIIKISLNHLLYSFNCEIYVDIMNNVFKRKISAALDHIKKLYQLYQDLHLQLIEVQEQMTVYYNTHHMPKQFKVKDLIKLLIKYLKLKYPKLSSCQIGPFRILEQIDDQAYQIALFNKYA